MLVSPRLALLVLLAVLPILYQNCGTGFSVDTARSLPSTTIVDEAPAESTLSKVYDVRIWSSTDLVRMYLFDSSSETAPNQISMAAKFASLIAGESPFATLASGTFREYLGFEPKVFEVVSLASEPGFVYLANDAGTKVLSLRVDQSSISIHWEVTLLERVTTEEFRQSQLTLVNGVRTLYVGRNQIQNVTVVNPAILNYISTCASGEHLSNGVCVSSTRACVIENGTGIQQWTGMAWGACQVVTCNTGYMTSSNSCVLQVAPTPMPVPSPTPMPGPAPMPTPTPVPPVAVGGWKQVSAGASHTCAVNYQNKVYCWGDNSYGQLGTGTLVASRIPVEVRHSTTFKRVSSSSFHTCAIDNQDRVFCWGDGDRVGNGTGARSTAPVAVVGLPNAKEISSGTHGTCAIDLQDRVYCWGTISAAQNRWVAVAMTSLPRAKQVSVGNVHACAIDDQDRLLCWGSNRYGELGNGSVGSDTGFVLTPVLVTGPNMVAAKQVSAGYFHTCAINSQNKLFCWGDLGNQRVSAPLEVSGLSNTKKVSASLFNTCAIDELDRPFCWSVNSRPALVTGLVGVKDISTFSHSCAIDLSDNLFCWGVNNAGQLGNGSATGSPTPVAVSSVN